MMLCRCRRLFMISCFFLTWLYTYLPYVISDLKVCFIMPFMKKKKQKLLSVRISTYDADLEFSVEFGTKAKNIFDLVCHTMGLRETWYFGLSFTTDGNKSAWVKPDKKIIEQTIPKSEDDFLLFKFSAKFYPEVYEEELIQEVTRHLFFLQFQHLILSEELHCQPEASILLASYAVQAKFGDYDPDIHKPGFLSNEVLLPQSVNDQFQSVTGQMWEEQITNWYAGYHGLSRDEAELEYLKIVQDFEMSGVNYFKVKDENGTEMWLGIDAKSVSIYPMADKLHPVKSYQWSDLSDMSYRGNNFVIKHTNRAVPGGGTLSRRRLNWKSSTANLNANTTEDLCFITEDQETNKLILDLCKGNHDLFMLRRKVDSMEMQHMKAQAREEKERKQMERDRLKKERDLRIQIQQEKEELEEKLKHFQEENRAAADTLGRSEETAELLSEKASVAEEEAMLLGMKVNNAENEIQRYQVEAAQLQETNRNLKQKLLKFDQLTSQLSDQTRAKTAEVETLRKELYVTKQALNEANLKLSRINNMHHSPSTSGNIAGVPYMPVNQSHGQVMAMHSYGQNGTANQPHHSPTVSGSSNSHQNVPYHLYSPKRSSNGSEVGSQADRNSRDFSTASTADMQQLSQEIEKERAEYQVKSRSIEQQLLTLRSELEELKVSDEMSLSEQIQPTPYAADVNYAVRSESQQRPQQYGGL